MNDTSVDLPQTVLDLDQSLADVFGFNQFRPGQEQTVTQLLDGFSSPRVLVNHFVISLALYTYLT
jgi:superfamily II DNA helicase RecQ